MQAAQYTMKMTALRTGLTPHVIRMWERRYEAVMPRRTATGRRLYSGEELERLTLLRAATLNGHSISHVAALPTAKLQQLQADDAPSGAAAHYKPQDSKQASYHLEQCLRAVEQMDAMALEDALTHTAIQLGHNAMIDRVLEPLMEQISDLWRAGTLRIAHEHLATEVIRVFLAGLTRHAPPVASAPIIIVTTPANQMHEIGALMAAATAASEGWRILYLGPNMPAEEIVLTARQVNARAVALSIIFPADDPKLHQELRQLKAHLAPAIAIIVGGRAAHSYGAVLHSIGAKIVTDMLGLRYALEALRATPGAGAACVAAAQGGKP